MSKLLSYIAIVIALLIAGYAHAAIPLPDPTVYVNLASHHTTVGVAGKYYGAPSQFLYLAECPKADDSRYHCDIDTETDVVLKASDGSTITVTITAQFAATLITSGHIWWRSSQIVLSGTVAGP